MVGKLVKSCTDCSSLEDAICTLDRVLARYGNDAWQNISFEASNPVPYLRLRQLVYYRQMLSRLVWNQNFYCPYELPSILSRVMALLAGEFVPKPLPMPIYAIPVCGCDITTTTTTTTTSTSTSTTTTSTTSTTTTTTTTLGPVLLVISNQSTGAAALTFSNATYNGVPIQTTFPVPFGAGQDGHTQSIEAGATVVVSVAGPVVAQFDHVQCVYLVDSEGNTFCQIYLGSGDYTFSNVVWDLTPSTGQGIYVFEGGGCSNFSPQCSSGIPAAQFVLDSMSCAAPQTALFCSETSVFNFGTGSTLYSDPDGTNILTGHTTVMLIDEISGNSDVYQLSPVTGMVGSSLGPCS